MSIYLDYNATTPMDLRVIEAVTEAASSFWMNPHSSYDILFMSSGTEANLAVINTFSRNFTDTMPHMVTTNVEHPSVLMPLRRMESLKLIELSIVPVQTSTGTVAVDDIVRELRPHQTVLVSVMLANNVTGAIMPVKEIVAAVRQWNSRHAADGDAPYHRVYVHSDIAQAVGKMAVNLRELGLDYASIVGHKFYGPRIACLYVRGAFVPVLSSSTPSRPLGDSPPDGSPLVPIFLGGGQEFGFRAGTENTPMIVGLGKAAELVSDNLSQYTAHMMKMRDFLELELRTAFPSTGPIGVCIFGVDACNGGNSELNASERLPNTVNVTFTGNQNIDSRDILARCPMLLASRDAACHSVGSGSSVLLACGYSEAEAKSALRLSVGRDTTIEHVSSAVSMIRDAVLAILLPSRENGNGSI